MKSCIGFALLLGAFAAGCRTIETKRPIFHSQPVRTASPTRMFEVQHEGAARGYVVLFEAQASPQDAVYVVRNRHHQDLGVIDALGRAFRYRPHEDDPAWLGSGSVVRGVQRILNTDSLPAMREISLPETPASPVSRGERIAGTESQRTD